MWPVKVFYPSHPELTNSAGLVLGRPGQNPLKKKKNALKWQINYVKYNIGLLLIFFLSEFYGTRGRGGYFITMWLKCFIFISLGGTPDFDLVG